MLSLTSPRMPCGATIRPIVRRTASSGASGGGPGGDWPRRLRADVKAGAQATARCRDHQHGSQRAGDTSLAPDDAPHIVLMDIDPDAHHLAAPVALDLDVVGVLDPARGDIADELAEFAPVTISLACCHEFRSHFCAVGESTAGLSCARQLVSSVPGIQFWRVRRRGAPGYSLASSVS